MPGKSISKMFLMILGLFNLFNVLKSNYGQNLKSCWVYCPWLLSSWFSSCQYLQKALSPPILVPTSPWRKSGWGLARPEDTRPPHQCRHRLHVLLASTQPDQHPQRSWIPWQLVSKWIRIVFTCWSKIVLSSKKSWWVLWGCQIHVL